MFYVNLMAQEVKNVSTQKAHIEIIQKYTAWKSNFDFMVYKNMFILLFT